VPNPFTDHPAQQGESYGEHARFALPIGFRLLTSAGYFLVHALMPAIPIPTRFNLSAMAAFLSERNERRS